MSTVDGKLDVFLRMGIAYALMFLLFMLNLISFSTPLYTVIEIPFVFMMLYYWSIYRPTLLSPFLVFIFGLIFDLLSGWPLGITSFVFLVLRQLVADQRLFLTGQPFTVIWLGYCIVSAAALSLHWALYGFVNLQWTPFLPVGIMIGVGVFLFPLISAVLHLSHRLLPLVIDQYSAVK